MDVSKYEKKENKNKINIFELLNYTIASRIFYRYINFLSSLLFEM